MTRTICKLYHNGEYRIMYEGAKSPAQAYRIIHKTHIAGGREQTRTVAKCATKADAVAILWQAVRGAI